MLNRLTLVISCLILIVSTSLKPEIETRSTYVHFKRSLVQVRYLREGLLCSSIYKDKYHVDFFRINSLNKKSVEELKRFTYQSNIWLMDSIYVSKDLALSSPGSTIILNKELTDEYKRIVYDDCFNPVLDSLIVYLNNLIPLNKRKFYDINKFRSKPDQGNCK